DIQEVVKYGAIPKVLTHPGWHCTAIQLGQQEEVGCAHHVLPNTIPSWETVFTGMFMHASILHIAGNMLFLWIFGNNVEDAMGSPASRASAASPLPCSRCACLRPAARRFLPPTRCTEPLRTVVFMLAVVFIGGMALLTALDFSNNGVTLVGVVGVLVLVVVG